MTLAFPSGYRASFQQGLEQLDIVATEKWYRENAEGFLGFVYREKDALVADRREQEIGQYWEVTACSSPVSGRAICVGPAGALVEHSGPKPAITKLSKDEALSLVTIARSLRALEPAAP